MNGILPGRQTYGQSDNSSIYNIGFGIQKQLWQRQGTIRLCANDLFHTLNLRSQILGVNGVEALIPTLTIRTS
ncbi:outer membrane beta-barrel protein [Mucilaginibacter celer]|uniref:Outer membrane protein beta-barrel domain-containing protein n=1 Tax=Mucilaginibacter celer TaxID=2305508 RepID=A0A494VM00_9SPHI|nr:hypothetical protein HYN43_010115 [Mucilaginibacter celer]